MPFSAIISYLDMLSKRQAEMRMMQGEAASVPYMDEAKHDEWKKSINQFFENRLSEIAAPSKLIGLGIKPIFVKPDPHPALPQNGEHVFGEGNKRK